MNALIIDTTTNNMVVIVVRGDDIIDGTVHNVGTKHSETLCNVVQNTMTKANLTFSQLDTYACAIGPGSFTGIRIGVATVKGYCVAQPKQLVAIKNLQLLAIDSGKQHCTTVIDAGNGWYVASYNNGYECTAQPQLVPYDTVDNDSVVKWDGTHNYTDAYVRYVKHAVNNNLYTEQLCPLYIRKSQAELNR